MERKVPLGVKILAGLYFFALGWYFLGLWVLLSRFGYVLHYAPWTGLVLAISTGLMLAIGAVWYGLLKLNPTAWRVAMVLFLISLVTNIIAGNVGATILGVIIIAYLYSKRDLYLGSEREAVVQTSKAETY